MLESAAGKQYGKVAIVVFAGLAKIAALHDDSRSAHRTLKQSGAEDALRRFKKKSIQKK